MVLKILFYTYVEYYGGIIIIYSFVSYSELIPTFTIIILLDFSHLTNTIGANYNILRI